MGAPCFSRGKLDFNPALRESLLRRALAPDVSSPALKRMMIRVEAFPGALKRSFPHINAGASTKKCNARAIFSAASEGVLHPRYAGVKPL